MEKHHINVFWQCRHKMKYNDINCISKSQMKENIFAIKSGRNLVGHGFLADGYFITAVHVLAENDNCFVFINGEIKEFNKATPMFVGRGKISDANFIDMTFFKFEKIDGGFHVSDYIPQKDEVLNSCCLHNNCKTNDSEYEIDVEPAYSLGEVEGNYFHCKCNRHEGSSGSPLIKDNHVIGIMHGGRKVKDLLDEGRLSEKEKEFYRLFDDDILCSFLKIGVFMELRESAENNNKNCE